MVENAIRVTKCVASEQEALKKCQFIWYLLYMTSFFTPSIPFHFLTGSGFDTHTILISEVETNQYIFLKCIA